MRAQAAASRSEPHGRAERERDKAVLAELRKAAQRHRPHWLNAEPDDIAHRAYEKIRPRLEAGETLSPAYLRRVAYTVCIDVLRSERAERRRRDEWGHPPEDRDDSPEAAVRNARVAEHISACVGALPEARRRVAVLHLQGHGNKEISVLLQEPYKRVENLVYRALAAIRNCLSLKGVTPP